MKKGFKMSPILESLIFLIFIIISSIVIVSLLISIDQRRYKKELKKLELLKVDLKNEK